MPRMFEFDPEWEQTYSSGSYLQFTHRYPTMDIQDHRPFDTMFRLISSMEVKVYFDDDQLILRMPNGYQKKVSVAGVLYACIEESHRLGSTARTSFERQCCEEDEEELRMLLDAYYLGVNKETLKGNRVASEWPTEVPAEAEPAVATIAHEELDDLEAAVMADKLSNILPALIKRVDRDYIPPYLLA